MPSTNSFHSASTLQVGEKSYRIYRIDAIETAGAGSVARLPYSIRVVLENLLRNEDGSAVKRSDIEYVAKWDTSSTPQDIDYRPARVILQDFTGVPCVVDLAAMRDALQKVGADPKLANPLIPCDLVIDHSVQVDSYASKDSFGLNVMLEYQRNRERYALLRWAQKSFRNFRAVPPGTGIVHQVNLEYLASVVFTEADTDGTTLAYPDTCVGTDSHTTMISGLGVVGWGVGGIEAEACLLGQSISMLLPPVIGFKLKGRLPEGATATDMVLTVTQMLRKKGVVGKFVEFYGDGVSNISVADRATIANMAPEYGATIGYFPIDHATLDYLRMTNRSDEQIALVEAYSKVQGLFLNPGDPEPVYNDTLELDLSKVVPSLAGPKRPQDRLELPQVKPNFQALLNGAAPKTAVYGSNGTSGTIQDGAVVIAAITSCTNTSNPAVMIAAGLLAKKAVEKGLHTKPWVKTSLAPGSKVVMDYYHEAGLVPSLEALGFHLVGYGCTTCIGNSGPLPEPISDAVTKEKLIVAAVLSGNRNFEGRVNSQVRANYLASPPLVVAYAIAGRVDVDLTKDALGIGKDGKPVFLRDIWPTNEEIDAAVKSAVKREFFAQEYGSVLEGDANWKSIPLKASDLFDWDAHSTYVKKPPYFENMADPSAPVIDLHGLKVLASLGDSVTTDHISPAGNIEKGGPAAKWLMEHGVKQADFNSYGARRGHDDVMTRGTFANIRLKNLIAPGTEGGWTTYKGEQMSIFDASLKYKQEGVGLIVIAGKEYGSGSSRDWAAKGAALLGVKAVLAESYERIHRSNLVAMGVLPFEFLAGESRESHGLTGFETYEFTGIAEALAGSKQVTLKATDADGQVKSFAVKLRVDTPREVEYFRSGGILPYVLRQVAARQTVTA